MREIYFYTCSRNLPINEVVLTTWDETEAAIRDRKNQVIHTTQMGLLDIAWDDYWDYGDQVFVYDDHGCFELNTQCTRTNRDLRQAHNVFKIWRAGGFEK